MVNKVVVEVKKWLTARNITLATVVGVVMAWIGAWFSPEPQSVPPIADAVPAITQIVTELDVKESKILLSEPGEVWLLPPKEQALGLQQIPTYGGLDENGDPIVVNWLFFTAREKDSYNIYKVNPTTIKVTHNQIIVGGGGGSNPIASGREIMIPEPTPELKSAVASLPDVDDEYDARHLVLYHYDFADLLARNPDLTPEQIISANQKAGTLMFNETGIHGKYPGLGTKLDTLVNAYTDNLHDLFLAIAWRYNQ